LIFLVCKEPDSRMELQMVCGEWLKSNCACVPTGAEMSGRLLFIFYGSWATGSCGGFWDWQQWEHRKVEKNL